jgi:hypothetical protein
MNKALPSGPRRDEAVDEEDRRQRKRALGRVMAAIIQSLQAWMEIMSLLLQIRYQNKG